MLVGCLFVSIDIFLKLVYFCGLFYIVFCSNWKAIKLFIFPSAQRAKETALLHGYLIHLFVVSGYPVLSAAIITFKGAACAPYIN